MSCIQGDSRDWNNFQITRLMKMCLIQKIYKSCIFRMRWGIFEISIFICILFFFITPYIFYIFMYLYIYIYFIYLYIFFIYFSYIYYTIYFLYIVIRENIKFQVKKYWSHIGPKFNNQDILRWLCSYIYFIYLYIFFIYFSYIYYTIYFLYIVIRENIKFQVKKYWSHIGPKFNNQGDILRWLCSVTESFNERLFIYFRRANCVNHPV